MLAKALVLAAIAGIAGARHQQAAGVRIERVVQGRVGRAVRRPDVGLSHEQAGCGCGNQKRAGQEDMGGAQGQQLDALGGD
jgi:hypothetical protein